MKNTGIVRRLDDLGRIVIPKEIRKTMNITTGEPIEIYVEKDALILKKYSQVADNSSLVEIVAESLYGTLNKGVVITDLESVISAKGKASFLKGDKITSNAISIIKDKKSFIITKNENLKPIKLTYNDENKFSTQIIVPIISNSQDGVGLIALLDDDGYTLNANDIKFLKMASSILSLDKQSLWVFKGFLHNEKVK